MKGAAAAAINGLTLTDSNYDEAVQILHDRFGNKQLLISANMERLLSIKEVHNAEAASKIRELYNDVETCVRNLRSLNVGHQEYGQALISIVWGKLPGEIQLIMSRQLPVNQEWETDRFLEVLRKEVESREICSHLSGAKKTAKKAAAGNASSGRDGGSFGSSGGNDEEYTTSTLHTSTERNNRITCTYCRGNHASVKCDVITEVMARKTILRKKARCFVCLKSGHKAHNCRSNIKCYKCQQKHHTSICETQNDQTPPPPPPPPAAAGDAAGVQTNVVQANIDENPHTDHVLNTTVAVVNTHTLLQTAKAITGTSDQNCEQVRVLFDNCAQRSFITTDVKERLNLTVQRRDRMLIKAFEGKNEEIRMIEIVCAKFRGVGKSDVVMAELCVVPKICSALTGQSIELAQVTYEHLIDIELADSTDGKSELRIDVLIGGDFYWNFVTERQIRGGSGPVAVDTILGWVLSGP